jgi:hypothetical protein
MGIGIVNPEEERIIAFPVIQKHQCFLVEPLSIALSRSIIVLKRIQVSYSVSNPGAPSYQLYENPPGAPVSLFPFRDTVIGIKVILETFIEAKEFGQPCSRCKARSVITVFTQYLSDCYVRFLNTDSASAGKGIVGCKKRKHCRRRPRAGRIEIGENYTGFCDSMKVGHILKNVTFIDS